MILESMKKAGVFEMERKEERRPLFSVIVPTFNNEKEIRRCINSILAQTYKDFELILVDDGSIDNTLLICNRYAEADTRIRVMHKANEGAAAARNDGLFQAVGKYVYYVDADDWIAEELLQEAAYILACKEAPDIFIFGHEMIMGDGTSVSYSCHVKPGLYTKKRLKEEIYPVMMYPRGKKVWMPVVSDYLWDKIIYRELLLDHYCRDTSLYMGEDAVCAYECVYFADQIYFSSRIMYVYDSSSASSMHRKYHEDLLDNYNKVVRYYRTYLGGQDDEAIERQINRMEYTGLYYSIYQELQFSSSLYQSAAHFKRKMKQIRRWPVCSMKGLSFTQKGIVLLMSLRALYVLLVMMRFVQGLIRLRNKLIGSLKRQIVKRGQT